MLDFNFEVPSWQEVFDMLLDLTEKIETASFTPDIIVGVSRGGWVPARILSDLLETANTTSLSVEFYVDINKTSNEPRLTQQVPISLSCKRLLVVDDIVDTGRSAKLISDYLTKEGAGETRFLSLYIKPWSIFKPDFCGRETTDWVVFPWELKETLTKLEKKYRGSPDIFLAAVNRLIMLGFQREHVNHLLVKHPDKGLREMKSPF